MSIQIFDSLVHPTINGDWIMPKYPSCAHFESSSISMQKQNIYKCFAVGMENIGGYDEDLFIQEIKNYSKFIPIAFWNFNSISNTTDIYNSLHSIKEKGYFGIKLHPRFGNFNLDHKLLPFVIDIANELGLVVLFCTYFYSNKQLLSSNNIYSLVDLLSKISNKSSLILLHGGGVNLMEYVEVARAFPNVILDLSLTMCKYENSSIDNDIIFIFQSFDTRVCIGSDFPEISFDNLRRRFDYFSKFTTIEKSENIAYKNIEFLLKKKYDTI